MLKSVLSFAAIGTLSTLGLTMTGTIAQAQSQSSTFGTATVRPKFAPDPMRLKGAIGGAIAASIVAGTAETETGTCLGFIDQQPDHNLNLASRFRYLSIVAASSVDTTMVIKGPGGTWCNDDYDGKNAGIAGEWLPGLYNIWVGSYNKNRSIPYVLKISETR